MNQTMTPTRALLCRPATHSYAPIPVRTAPFGFGVEGTSLSRVRTLVVIKDTVQAPAMGPAARGRPL